MKQFKIVLSILLMTTGVVLAQDTAFTYTDGPHVVYKNDNTAVAYYLCEHGLSDSALSLEQYLSFSGLCCDSKNSYRLDQSSYETADAIIQNASKILAVSDIHGEFDELEQFLINAEVMDRAHEWTFGDGHLVIVGDIFDRGDQVTECLWLIYNLEVQSTHFGGSVHYLIGNHDQMVLIGDHRYVNEKYIKGIARKTRINYKDLFGHDTHFGRWLRSKNTIVKINEILFVHGGISPQLIDSNYTVASVNKTMQAGINLRSTQLKFDDSARFLFSSLGPLWYRGFHYKMEDRYPMATTADIDRATDYFDATHFVVGHSGVDSLTTLFDKRLIGVDIDLELLGTFEGLLWENGQLYRVKGDGSKIPL